MAGPAAGSAQSLMTLSVISRPPIDALRKAHFRVLSAVTRRTRSLLVIEDNARLRAI